MKKISLIIISFIILFYSSFVNASGITLSPNELNLGVGISTNIKVIEYNSTSSSTVIWSSSNPGVASINNGILTTHSIGKTIITATVNNQKALCTVNVISNYIPVSEISLTSGKETILLNESKNIDVKISPSNASNKTLTYSSSNPDIAFISETGNITGKKIGSSYITITAPGTSKKISLYVTVVDTIKLTGIIITSSLSINENTSSKLTVNFTPSDATNKNITWKSSDESIAIVDSQGNVTGKRPGTAEIKAISNDGGYVSTCKVTVMSISKELKSISLNKTSLTLEVGKEETLSVIFDPTYAENQKVTWKSSNERVAIVEKGVITAIKPGTAEIKVISDEGEKEAICELTVISLPIESISFEKESQTVYIGSTTTLKTISTPQDSAINNPIWTSSDESVATIKNGILSAIKEGTTVITVANEDESIKASTTITVVPKPAEPLNITVKGYELGFDPDKLDYTLKIGNESTLDFDINIDEDKVIINGNKDLKNGSIITITINDKTKKTYIINIKKKESYTIYFIGAISILLLINIIRMLIKSKKKA